MMSAIWGEMPPGAKCSATTGAVEMLQSEEFGGGGDQSEQNPGISVSSKSCHMFAYLESRMIWRLNNELSMTCVIV